MLDPTPLFSWPSEHRGLDWLQILPILAAIPAAAILLVGIVRGRLLPAVAIAGIVFLPVAAYALGMLLIMEDSKTVSLTDWASVIYALCVTVAPPGISRSPVPMLMSVLCICGLYPTG